MKTPRPFPSEHQLARRSRWAMLLLEWVLAIAWTWLTRFDGKPPRALEKPLRFWLAQMRLFVGRILFVRAAPKALEIRAHMERRCFAGMRCSGKQMLPARTAAVHKPYRFRNAPPGFAWRRSRRSDFRLALGARIDRALRAKDLIDQIRVLWRALENPKPLVAILIKRLVRGFRNIRLAAIGPPALVLNTNSPAAAPISADTS